MYIWTREIIIYVLPQGSFILECCSSIRHQAQFCWSQTHTPSLFPPLFPSLSKIQICSWYHQQSCKNHSLTLSYCLWLMLKQLDWSLNHWAQLEVTRFQETFCCHCCPLTIQRYKSMKMWNHFKYLQCFPMIQPYMNCWDHWPLSICNWLTPSVTNTWGHCIMLQLSLFQRYLVENSV